MFWRLQFTPLHASARWRKRLRKSTMVFLLALMLSTVDQWLTAYCADLYGGQGYIGWFNATTCECRRVRIPL